jgi:hypothetical protein
MTIYIWDPKAWVPLSIRENRGAYAMWCAGASYEACHRYMGYYR